MNAVNSFVESQSRKIETSINVKKIDTVKLDEQKIIDREYKVNVTGNSLLDIKNKIDSLKTINQREESERKAWREHFNKLNED